MKGPALALSSKNINVGVQETCNSPISFFLLLFLATHLAMFMLDTRLGPVAVAVYRSSGATLSVIVRMTTRRRLLPLPFAKALITVQLQSRCID